MSTEFCQHCKQTHPGRECDYAEPGECTETQVTAAEIPELAPAPAVPREPDSDATQG